MMTQDKVQQQKSASLQGKNPSPALPLLSPPKIIPHSLDYHTDNPILIKNYIPIWQIAMLG